MKIVVIGATGRIGGKLVSRLRQDEGCWVVEASPSRGVDAVTGAGLEEALDGAQVVVDVSNSPSPEGEAPLRFFETAGRRLTAAARAAGVRHRIALSIVGTDSLQASSYFRGKKIQEDLVRDSGAPFTILRSTAFFDFIAAVVQAGGEDDVVISSALAQPVSAIDVAGALAELAMGAPLNGMGEIAGPELIRLSDIATDVATAYEDPRRIIGDPHALYFGAELTDRTLIPGPGCRIGPLRFEDWLRQCLASRDGGPPLQEPMGEGAVPPR